MPRIAFLTFGILVEPWGDAAVAGFEGRLDRTFDAADASPGFISRSLDYEPTPDDPYGAREWGPYRRSTLYPGVDDPEMDTEAATLSLWRDLESVHAFAYSGPHLEALKRRSEWFEPRRWPTYVAWWVADDTIPSWNDAYTRLERLHAEGPTAEAFDFLHPFDPDGRPTRLDRRVATRTSPR